MNKGLELYKHNEEAYRKIDNAYQSGEDVVGIVHATGTGKSYLALNLAYHNQDKKVVYIVPSNGIIEHLENIIKESGLSKEKDFANVEFRTYQSLVNLSLEEMENINCDLLILDEFHHLGAPIWGARTKTLIETHSNIKIFGMTAYTVRDRNTSYERDMANPETDELFSNKIVSRYDLCDAIIDGILPQNITYKTSVVGLEEILKKLEDKTSSLGLEEENNKELEAARKRIAEAPSIAKIIKETIHSNSKLIYFCPPFSEKDVNDIETIKKEALKWFKQITGEENIVFYSTTSEMGTDGKKNREAFYQDVDLSGNNVSNKLRVMFAINQYNEGIHAPNVDGVIMGRGTSSDIVFFEQLGRALAVNRNNNPVIIDLAGNYTYMNELENNIKDRIKEQSEKTGRTNKRKNIPEVKFNIEIQNIDIFNFLSDYYKRINRTWNDYYELARKYYETHGDLEVPSKFKTNDGITYDPNGKINLGIWIANQRQQCLPTSERGKLLLQIGMRFENKNSTLKWEEMYKYAQKYYEAYGNLEIPLRFKTNNGFTYDSNGKINLGRWITNQRQRCLPESEQGKLLLQIGMRFENKVSTLLWNEMYEYAKKYYETHGDLEVPAKFKTNDGTTYDSNGKINLGCWIANQRQKCPPESERGKLLLLIGMRFENKKSTLSWKEIYEYAKKYYESHGDLEIPVKFKTNDGINYNPNGQINLGQWISKQRRRCLPESEREKLLLQIDMRFENKNSTLSWKEMYELAKKYYEVHGNLEIPRWFKTNDGVTYDPNGKINLGQWITNQRYLCPIKSEQGKSLLQIGMRFQNKNSTLSWKEMHEYAKKYYESHGDLEIPVKFKTNDGKNYDINGKINLGRWIDTQRQKCLPESEQGKLLLQIGMRFNLLKDFTQIKNICLERKIDTELNKQVTHVSSLKEFIAKIKLSEELGINLIDENGKLNQIFYMNNEEFKNKFGYSVEDLINKYNLDDKSKLR